MRLIDLLLIATGLTDYIAICQISKLYIQKVDFSLQAFFIFIIIFSTECAMLTVMNNTFGRNADI